MNKTLTLGSLFDGSGTFPMAGILSGITPVWASEIEPFPIAVTQKRLPFMKHYGNISKLNGADLSPVDIITFGSPCTDLSVAGKRAGIQAERSGLFFEAIRIIKEMRCKTNGEYPKYIVWENVPGAFSSGGGEDFRCVLEEICKIADESAVIPKPAKWHNAGEILAGHYSVAYRLFDAQYWGVPQRRKRIYLVADFTGECAGKILFESEGVSGYSAESFRAWQRAAGGAADCIRKASELCLNDQGGNRMDVTEDMTCTLRAEAHHPPCVLSAGFCTEHSAKARGIGYEEEKSPTLRAGVVPAALSCYENHSQDTRYRGPLDVAPTVSATYGMGGNNQPFVVNTPVTLKIRSGCEGGGKGAIWQEDKSATLSCNNDQTLFAPKAYGISAFESNAMKSDNPHSGVYEADTSRTLDCGGGTPACNQGGMAIVESYALQGSMIGRADKNGPQGDGVNEDVSFTLNTCDKHAVVYAIDRESYNCGQNFARNMGISENGVSSTLNAQGPSAVATPVYTSSKNSFFTRASEDCADTLVATDYKDPPLINDVGYTVRRLTPQECALLQGMPTWWCQDIGIENPTEEDINFWRDVFETHRLAVSPEKKPKTDKQIQKWLKNPHSDSAEYRMWGNGLSLPTAWFVLAGIAHYAKQ
ncbi:MAG: DNA cytosine methyltransferase [Ruminococcus sp.]|nr:DNA cytosine methyltransferase [Ruminococcus sp.]